MRQIIKTRERLKEFFFSIYNQLFPEKKRKIYEELLPYERDLEEHSILIQFKGEKAPCQYTVQEFEGLMETTYAKHLMFPSKKVYQMIRELCKSLFDAGMVEPKAEWIGVVYRNQIDTGSVKRVSIRYVDDIVGFGLFLEESVKEGEVIGEYTGLVRRCFPFFCYPNEYCFRYPLYRLLFGSYTIDAEKYTNEISFINHSKNPNSTSAVSINHHIFHVLIRASRDLEKGEELTFDYGSPIEDVP